MASPVALIALFSLALFAGITEARKDPGEYRKTVAKYQALVEAIENLVHEDPTHLSNKKSFATDFEPRPNVSAYGDDAKLKEDKTFTKVFEPRPNVSAYGDDSKLKQDKSFTKDFEPRPNVSAYNDGVGLKGEKDFEPRPNVSVYSE